MYHTPPMNEKIFHISKFRFLFTYFSQCIRIFCVNCWLIRQYSFNIYGCYSSVSPCFEIVQSKKDRKEGKWRFTVFWAWISWGMLIDHNVCQGRWCTFYFFIPTDRYVCVCVCVCVCTNSFSHSLIHYLCALCQP